MPKRRQRPPADPVEQDFLKALDRLKANTPKHSDLAKKAKLGTLKINFSTVAKEAGRSRTLIALDNCRYPNIRAEVQAAITPVSETRTAEDVIRNLRYENAELRKRIKLTDSVNAALILRLRNLEKAAKREISAVERRAKRNGRDPHTPVGSTLSIESGQVISFHKDIGDELA